MTAPAPTDAGALREALATVLCDCLRYDRERGIIIGIADAVDEALAGPLASLLAARATTDADLAKARDEIAGLKAALKLCLAELNWQTGQAKHCGDPNHECPMQDIHNPDDGHLLARNAARAALTSEPANAR